MPRRRAAVPEPDATPASPAAPTEELDYAYLQQLQPDGRNWDGELITDNVTTYTEAVDFAHRAALVRELAPGTYRVRVKRKGAKVPENAGPPWTSTGTVTAAGTPATSPATSAPANVTETASAPPDELTKILLQALVNQRGGNNGAGHFDAWQKGYQQGFEQGKVIGRAEAQAEFEREPVEPQLVDMTSLVQMGLQILADRGKKT